MYRGLCVFLLIALSRSALSFRVEPVDPILEKCKTQTSTEFEITQEFLGKLHSDPVPLLKNLETRCFSACILTENKTLKPDGSLNAEFLSRGLPENIHHRDEIIEAFNACANEKGNDSCETAYKTAVCINNQEVIRSQLLSN